MNSGHNVADTNTARISTADIRNSVHDGAITSTARISIADIRNSVHDGAITSVARTSTAQIRNSVAQTSTVRICDSIDNLENANKVLTIYEALLAHYGDLRWWPAKTPYEVMVGAVLTQNTAWSNVEKAIANFGDKLSPTFIADVDNEELALIIRPSGFFNQKAGYLKKVTEWFAKYDYCVATVQREPLERLRSELLATKGIGRETADSILLYAFGFPTFVIDAYTVRLCQRYPIEVGNVSNGYEALKDHFEKSLPHRADVYNNLHAMIVINAKNYCRKNAICDKCPLRSCRSTKSSR